MQCMGRLEIEYWTCSSLIIIFSQVKYNELNGKNVEAGCGNSVLLQCFPTQPIWCAHESYIGSSCTLLWYLYLQRMLARLGHIDTLCDWSGKKHFQPASVRYWLSNFPCTGPQRTHAGLNHGPADLQSAALPLSYTSCRAWHSYMPYFRVVDSKLRYMQQ